MVLPRPLILAIAGLALILMSFLVVQRQRAVSDSPVAAARVPAPADRGPAKAPTSPAKAAPSDKPAADRGPAKAAPGDKPSASRRAPKSPSRPTAARATPAPAEEGVPSRVARALADRKVIAVLFTLDGAADDSATRSALRAVETGGRKRRVAVFSDSIDNVGRYARLVGGLGISQVPSLVIVDTERQARLLEGYVDAGTLRQYVADAQR